MAGYVPTNVSMRFGPSFHGNRRAVRGMTTLAALAAIGALALPASAADRAGAPAPPANCAATTLPSGAFVAAGPGTPGIEDEFAEATLDGSVGVTPLTDILEFGTPPRPLRAGDSLRCTVDIRNRRTTPVTLRFSPHGILGSRARTGVGIRFVEPGDRDAAATAASWLHPAVPTITLRPRQLVHLPVTITVPERAPTGTVAGGIGIDLPRPPAGGSRESAAVGIESRVDSQFLLQVGGEGRPRLHLRDVRAPHLRWDRDPWTLRADLDNDGTLHATPTGRVRVRSPFGNTVTELAISDRPLLPGGRLRVARTWDGVPWFGIYRYDVRVGAAGRPGDTVARASGWFVALPPLWVLVLVGLGLVAAILAAMYRRRRERAWAQADDAAAHGDDEFDDELGDGFAP
ncbi:MAG: hypothetical protein JWM98_1008 [Thermoleophilia bacterium]|nr:hypothetical protein [Thermoleophilia bacterium]